MADNPERRLLEALVEPHPSITSGEDRLGARLFSILLLVQILVAVVMMVAIDAILSRAFGRHVWGDRDTQVVMAGCGFMLAAYGLIRAGRYRPGVAVYIATAVTVAVVAPFSRDANADIAMLASAIIPVLLTSIAFDYRWVLGALVATLLPASILLFATDVTSHRLTTGITLIGIVAVTGGLIIAYRHHLNTLEAQRLVRMRESEETLRKTEMQYRQLFGAISDAILIAGTDGRVLEANDAACRDLGYSRGELVGMPLDEVSNRPPGAVGETQRLVSTYGRAVFETLHRRKDGSVMPVELLVSMVEFAGKPAFLGIARDLTERRRGEDERRRMATQLQQAAKMESVGMLAGGVAHDFNNLLTAILGNADLASQDVEAGSAAAASLAEIQTAATSAAALTRQLLAFSRKQVIEPRVIDLNELVGRTHTMLRRLIGEDIRLGLTLTTEPARIEADPGLVEQVLLNLAVNARDAMPDGGVLSIETAIVGLDEGLNSRYSVLPPGTYVRLAVTDTGVGMSPEVQAHLFEPFFTTKSKGRGTGLGLATVYGAVSQSGGGIDVSSGPGVGSTFRVYLPWVGTGDLESSTNPAASDAGHGRETILLVEDDDGVRALVQRILEGLGYRVLVAPDGERALDLEGSHADHLDLLLTDVVMPGMNGRQLAERVIARRPGIRVLYTSGYTDDAVIQRGVEGDGLAFIGKPYSPQALGAKVREILDRP